MIDRIVLGLMAGSAVFGTLLSVELSAAGDDPVVVSIPSRSETPAPPAAPTPQRPVIDQLVQTALSQPLFSPTRRPPDAAVSSRDTNAELANMRLTGIVLEPQLRIAIFAVPGGKPLARAEGEAINDWRVESIGLTQVSLIGAAGTMVLEPKSDPSLVRPKQTVGAPTVNPLPASAAGTKPAPPAVPGQPPTPAAAAQPVLPRGIGQHPVPVPRAVGQQPAPAVPLPGRPPVLRNSPAPPNPVRP